MKLPSPALCSLLLALAVGPSASRAADVPKVALQPGVRLLEVELVPAEVTLQTAKCDPLVIAVGKTTLEHPGDALSILYAALTRGVVKEKTGGSGAAELLLPCSCARRIFLASVAAAPRRASEILDLAVLLYPGCTAEFADALKDYDSRGRAALESEDLSGHSGFGVGFGPGFPGSPGFSGSAPSGANALPPGTILGVPPVAITSVVNG